MAKIIPPLTEFQVKNAKPRQKSYKLFDGGGLYVEVMPSGSRIWRMKFRQSNGKENTLTFGPYPEISIMVAREKRTEARRLQLQGIDPGKHRDDARRLAACVFHANWTPVPPQTGQSFQRKLDTCSRPNWTPWA